MRLFPQKLTEHDLIAYHLHELSPREERAVRRVLQTDAAMAEESEAIAETLRQFSPKEAYPLVDAAVLERSWEAVRASLPKLVRGPVPQARPGLRGWHYPVLVGAGACTVAATTALLLMKPRPHPAPMMAAHSSSSPALREPERMPTEKVGEDVSERRERMSAGPIGHGGRGISQGGETQAEVLEALPHAVVSAEHSSEERPADPRAPVTLPEVSTRGVGVPAESGSVSSARSGGVRNARPAFMPHEGPRKELTVAMLGNVFAGRSWSDSVGGGLASATETHSVKAVPSAGGLVSFHQQFGALTGYRVTASYSQPTFLYGYKPNAASTESSVGLKSQMYEISGTYVVRGPRYRRVRTSAEGGVGMLVFLSESTADKTYGAAAVVGVGAELAVSQHLSVQAQYRGLILHPPTFLEPTLNLPVSTAVTLNSQPSMGITYRFGEGRSF